MTAVAIASNRRHAEALVELLVDAGPLTAAECCDALGWPRGRFASALRIAREEFCPEVGVSIPSPTPEGGWRYEATTEWQPVEAGAARTLGLVEGRLAAVRRDVKIVLPHLKRGSREWRRANFLNKHLDHLLSTLEEING